MKKANLKDQAAGTTGRDMAGSPDEPLRFLDDEAEAGGRGKRPGHPEGDWKVLIVDDEKEVHTITRLALNDFLFQNRGLSFISAFSADEARLKLTQNPDIALIFLDVVMEEDDAGLQFARYVREDLGNSLVRLVLRTGQPGQAPERQVICDYDINDYKTKTELTVDRLFTTTVSALRSYSDLKTIDSNRRGLQRIVDSSARIFQLQSLDSLFNGVLEHMTAILSIRENAKPPGESLCIIEVDGDLIVAAGTGGYAELQGRPASETLSMSVLERLRKARRERTSIHNDHFDIVHIPGNATPDSFIYFDRSGPTSDLEKDLVRLFCSTLTTAFDNLRLNGEVETTQKEIVFTLGAIAETRSQETGFHVKRVAEYTRLLAIKAGLSAAEADLLRQASPLHDIGKIGIPDAVLNKAGRHTPEEWEIMKTHAFLGYEMLKHSKTSVLKAASLIALTHHEKWDGSGYPSALAGEKIHIYGRLTALADVFDALGSTRCYKKPWPWEDILAYLERQKGAHFDPRLVDLFFQHLDEFEAIRRAYVDPF